MINITDKEHCCGCNACGDICPKGAISFPQDEEGFWMLANAGGLSVLSAGFAKKFVLF